MRIVVTLLFVVVSGWLVTGCRGGEDTDVRGSDAPSEFTLKFGHLANEENTWHKAALKFKDVAERLSHGRIAVSVYPNSQIGTELELITGIQLGTVDMTITGESLQNWAPKAALLAVPYAFRDAEAMRAVADGEIGDEISAQIKEKTGLVPVAWFERGARHLTSNRPIKTPADLNGLKLRVPNVPLFVKVWKELGAKPTPMAFTEVFTALQQNTIDAQENPLSLIESASFFEVQQYVNLTAHVRSWIYVVIGKAQLDKMPPELQAVVLEAAREMQVYEHALFLEDEARLRVTLEDRGMEFVNVDTEAFRIRARTALVNALTPEQRELFDRL